MSRCRLALTLVTTALLVAPLPARAFSNKNGKKNPAERVSQLVLAVKTDKDEDKRAEAAHELRDFDPAKHPEIIPILIDVAQNDPKPSVRTEAIATLARFRPVCPEVGMALEQATKDSSFRVRWQARSSLVSYRLAGYRSGSKMDETMSMPQEGHAQNKFWNPFGLGKRSSSAAPGELTGMPPPESAPGKPWTQWFSFGKRSSNQAPPTVVTMPQGETAPPPLAQPDVRYSNPPRVLNQPRLVPSDTPNLQRPPTPAPSGNAGPDIPPQ
jgi:hypothetical protein